MTIKNLPDSTALKAAIANFTAHAEKKQKLIDEKAASETFVAAWISAGGTDDPEDEEKVHKARLRIEIIPARLDALDSSWQPLFEAIKTEERLFRNALAESGKTEKEALGAWLKKEFLGYGGIDAAADLTTKVPAFYFIPSHPDFLGIEPWTGEYHLSNSKYQKAGESLIEVAHKFIEKRDEVAKRGTFIPESVLKASPLVARMMGTKAA